MRRVTLKVPFEYIILSLLRRYSQLCKMMSVRKIWQNTIANNLWKPKDFSIFIIYHRPGHVLFALRPANSHLSQFIVRPTVHSLEQHFVDPPKNKVSRIHCTTRQNQPPRALTHTRTYTHTHTRSAMIIEQSRLISSLTVGIVKVGPGRGARGCGLEHTGEHAQAQGPDGPAGCQGPSLVAPGIGVDEADHQSAHTLRTAGRFGHPSCRSARHLGLFTTRASHPRQTWPFLPP